MRPCADLPPLFSGKPTAQSGVFPNHCPHPLPAWIWPRDVRLNRSVAPVTPDVPTLLRCARPVWAWASQFGASDSSPAQKRLNLLHLYYLTRYLQPLNTQKCEISCFKPRQAKTLSLGADASIALTGLPARCLFCPQPGCPSKHSEGPGEGSKGL